MGEGLVEMTNREEALEAIERYDGKLMMVS